MPDLCPRYDDHAEPGWGLEPSGSGERLEVTSDGRTRCTVGGYAAGTHYARIRRKLPEQDSLAVRGQFWVAGDLDLPVDFYTRKTSYARVLGTDNYVGKMKSTGALAPP